MKKVAYAMTISAALGIFGLAMVGCESGSQSNEPNYETRTAGGNGVFGETPAKPGRYQDPTNGSADAPPSPQPANQ